MPAEDGDNWCYISSGTWSLMGVELDQPVINEQSLRLNYTNEVGVGGKIRLLKNIAGLWLLQECQARLEPGRRRVHATSELTRMAADGAPVQRAHRSRRLSRTRRHAAQRSPSIAAPQGRRAPATHAEYARAILESLALRYRQVLEGPRRRSPAARSRSSTSSAADRAMRVLNQFVADCTGRRVVAGPSEATAIGNILVQAMGAGEIERPRRDPRSRPPFLLARHLRTATVGQVGRPPTRNTFWSDNR